MNKKGFTLVELSIVLVIIGLLVGGVLVGQSLIDSAKINSMIRQIQQFDIAQGVFYQKFKQLPGDSTLFTPQGDGDRKIAPIGMPSATESAAFFNHLVQGVGFKLEKPVAAGAAGVEVAKNSDGADSSGKRVYLTLASVELALDEPLAQGLIPAGWVIDSNMLGLGSHYVYTVQDAVTPYADPYSPQTSYTLDKKIDRKSTRLNSSHSTLSRMPSSA